MQRKCIGCMSIRGRTVRNSKFAHKDSILLKNIQGFGIYRNIYETIQLLVRTLSLSVNRSDTKFAEKASAHQVPTVSNTFLGNCIVS